MTKRLSKEYYTQYMKRAEVLKLDKELIAEVLKLDKELNAGVLTP